VSGYATAAPTTCAVPVLGFMPIDTSLTVDQSHRQQSMMDYTEICIINTELFMIQLNLFIYMVAQCCQLTGEDDAIAITRRYTEVTLIFSNECSDAYSYNNKQTMHCYPASTPTHQVTSARIAATGICRWEFWVANP